MWFSYGTRTLKTKETMTSSKGYHSQVKILSPMDRIIIDKRDQSENCFKAHRLCTKLYLHDVISHCPLTKNHVLYHSQLDPHIFGPMR